LIGTLLVFVQVDELFLLENELKTPANKQLGEQLDLLCGTSQMDEVEEFLLVFTEELYASVDEVEEFLLAFPEELYAIVDDEKNLEIATYLFYRLKKKEKKPKVYLLRKKITKDFETEASED
jgi:hypothetical protein